MTFRRNGNSIGPGGARLTEAPLPAEPVDGRYRLERAIGRGGMAIVYEAIDLTSGRRLALKRLQTLPEPRKQRRALQLFEREFHTLAHLAHPRVVEVYDYGRDDVGPYYTMELLDGGDLQQLAPLDWRRACALARDVCSALSLLHSRRMVHRDLGPRNVRCTSDGLAKLIDFGAMMVMGPSRQVVGTPAYCAPEALNLQALDQRTDLYSLGATLYYTLTGRHAYPAKSFAQLREQWRSCPVAPSAYRSEIPPALDALVLELMHLEAAARPANAAEVIARLAAIEGREADEHLLVPQSYLSTPNLIGRETALARARAKVMRAIRGRGSATMVVGAPGVGRSRLLDACMLEGKLLGALVLRADLGDAHSDYGVVRALVSQLLQAAPELAQRAAQPELAVLAEAVPELAGRDQSVELPAPVPGDQLRARLQQALRRFLVEVGRRKPLLIGVDDAHAIDEPSAAFLALLAHDLRRCSIAIVLTVDDSAAATSPSALKLLADASTRIELAELSREHTEQLLRSVFGDVPHIQLLAHKLHEVANGNPRDVMHLAEHLLDKGVVRYAAGAWSLPAAIDAGDLPSSMAQALRARVEALRPVALQLGRAMSLCPERGVALEECVLLCAPEPPSSVLAALDELIEAQVVTMVGESYVLSRRGFVPALQSGLEGSAARSLHEKLARMFERRPDEQFRRARHLLRAGLTEPGLDALIEHAAESQKLTDENPEAYWKLLQALPADWAQVYDEAIALCEQLGRPRRHAFTLRSRFSGLAVAMGLHDVVHLPNLLAQLGSESGLADYAALDPALEGMPRLVKALELTQQRYDQSGDHDRVLEPVLAIRQLGRTLVQACGVISTTLDYELWQKFPSLEPLEPLSPALSVCSMLVRGVGARITAHAERAHEEYVRMLERTGQPDRGGLDETHHRYARFGVMCGLGMIEASMGRASCLSWADAIESEPAHRVNALLIRMLHHLFQGDLREADRCKERAELLRLQNSSLQWFEGMHLLGQVVGCAAADSLTRMKQTIDEIDVPARRFPAWIPARHYAAGEYHRIRGDHASALAEFEAALARIVPGRYQLWPNIAGAHVKTLLELGRAAEAREHALAALEAARAAELGYVRAFLHMPLALAEAELGNAAAAIEHAHAAIDAFASLGSTGLLPALAYENRARVAIAVRDREGFAHYAALCAEQLGSGANRVVTAKYEKLKQVAHRAELDLRDAIPEAAHQTEQLGGSHLTSMLDSCRGARERAERGLTFVLKSCAASEGFLYVLSEAGPRLAAKCGEREPSEHLTRLVREHVEAELCEDEAGTALAAPGAGAAEALQPASELSAMHGERFRLVLLGHQVSGGFAITGVAVAVVKPGKPFVHPGRVAAELSRLLLDSGDAVPALVGSR